MICIFTKQFVLHTKANELVAVAVCTALDVFKKQQLFLVRICIYICTSLSNKLLQQE
jgi:hypothetical protein